MNKIKINYKSNMSYYEIAYFLKDKLNTNTVVVCIGTDKCIGDCLGPLVGSILSQKFFPIPIYGTIASPIHALNLDENLEKINQYHPNAEIIAIDACLGEKKSIGEIHIRDYPIRPGKGVGKKLTEVGIYSIIGIVESSENAEFFTSKSIRLNLIFEMAKIISDGILHAHYLQKNYL